MENLWVLIPILACPIGMGLMMFFMGKGMSRKRDEPPERERAPEPSESAQDRSLAEPGVEREPVSSHD